MKKKSNPEDMTNFRINKLLYVNFLTLMFKIKCSSQSSDWNFWYQLLPKF